MGVLLTFLGLAQAPRKSAKVKEQTIITSDNRKEMKLAQLESYMGADDNQGIADLALYF